MIYIVISNSFVYIHVSSLFEIAHCQAGTELERESERHSLSDYNPLWQVGPTRIHGLLINNSLPFVTISSFGNSIPVTFYIISVNRTVE